MAKIIEATAVISGKAGDMSGFAAISKQLLDVSKAGEAVKKAMAGASGDLGKRVEEISQKLAKIDNFKSMSKGLDQAGIAMRKAVQDANKLKTELDNVTRPTAKMKAEYDRAAQAVDRTTRAFREQGQAVRAARTSLADAGIPVNQIARNQAQLTAALDKTTQAMRNQAAAGRQMMSPWGAPMGGRRSGSGVPLIPLGVGSRNPAMPGMGGQAGDIIGGGAGLVAGGRAKQLAFDAIDSWRDMDEALRRQGAILGFDPKAQAPLKEQALRIGQDTRFSNMDVTKAQTRLGASLPHELQSTGVIAGITRNAKDYALAMGTTLDEGAEAILARMLASRYDMSSPAAAEASAKRAANGLVQLAKASGMSHEDLKGYTKFGTAPGDAAGFSEPMRDALAAQLRRLNYEGSMGGNFIRAAGMKLATPTPAALDALAAAGYRYSDYQKPGTNFSAEGLDDIFKRRFGRRLSKTELSSVREIFADETAIADQGTFQERISAALAGGFIRRTKGGKGPLNVQDSQLVNKRLAQFYTMNAQGVDIDRLMTDILKGGLTAPIARYLFGQEHGGRAQALRADQLERDQTTFKNTPGDRAEKIGADINAGFYGQYQQAIGAIETFKMRLGEANDGLLKISAGAIDKTFTALGNLPDGVLQIATAAGTATAALITLAGAARLASVAQVPGAGALGGWAGAALRWLPRAVGWAGVGYGAYRFADALTPKDANGNPLPQAALPDQGFRSGSPGFQGLYEKSWQAQKYREMDPEGARGRAMMNMGKPINIEASVKPDQITAQANVTGSATVNVVLQGLGALAGLISGQATATIPLGNGPGSTGRSQPEAAAPNTGASSAAP